MRIYRPGYNLYEMVIVLSIVAILLSIALPSMHRSILQHNCGVSYLQLKSAIKYVQEEAIRRDQSIVICPANYNVKKILSGCLKADNQNCQGWSCGILAYIDLEQSGDYSSFGAANLRINATRFDRGVIISALGSSQPLTQLMVSPDGLIHDMKNSSSWIFTLSPSRLKQRIDRQFVLNSYGSFCNSGEGGC